LKPEILSESTD